MIEGHGQVYFDVANTKAKSTSCMQGKSSIGRCYPIFLFIFFFSPNICMLLTLDTGYLWRPVMYDYKSCSTVESSIQLIHTISVNMLKLYNVEAILYVNTEIGLPLQTPRHA